MYGSERRFALVEPGAQVARALGQPVLANGQCDVLRGQCRRSNAGLYFDDYYEFREALSRLESDPAIESVREIVGGDALITSAEALLLARRGEEGPALAAIERAREEETAQQYQAFASSGSAI